MNVQLKWHGYSLSIWVPVCVGDGQLDKAELTQALSMCLQENHFDMEETNAVRLAELVFSKAKQDGGEDRQEESELKQEGRGASTSSAADILFNTEGYNKTLSYEELERMLQQNPVLYSNLHIR